MFERVKSAYTRRLVRRDLREGTDFKQASLDAQVKVIHNAKQKIIAELAKIMHDLNAAHSEQGRFQVTLASASNAFFKQVRQEEAGLRELAHMVTTGEGASMGRSEGAKLQFSSIQKMDSHYSKRNRHLQKNAAALEELIEKDEQFVMQHIFDIEYIRLLMAYFAYLTDLEVKLRKKSRRIDRNELKEIKKEGKDEGEAADKLSS